MKWKKLLPIALLAVMAIITLVIKNCNNAAPESKPVENVIPGKEDKKQPQPKTTGDKPTVNKDTKENLGYKPHGLNRNPAQINYSKHARCRMDCRHISEQEVRQILREGKINYAKSELKVKDDCKKKYAVEGYTSDNQHVRMIFAPCSDEVTVVTVIDLDKEWVCNCE